MPASSSVPFVEMRQLHAKHCGLNCIEPTIPTLKFVVVLCHAPVISQQTQPLGNAVVVRDDDPCITKGPQVFAWIATEAPNMSDGANAPALVPSSVRLACVLHHQQSVALRNGHDR